MRQRRELRLTGARRQLRPPNLCFRVSPSLRISSTFRICRFDRGFSNLAVRLRLRGPDRRQNQAPQRASLLSDDRLGRRLPSNSTRRRTGGSNLPRCDVLWHRRESPQGQVSHAVRSHYPRRESPWPFQDRTPGVRVGQTPTQIRQVTSLR